MREKQQKESATAAADGEPVDPMLEKEIRDRAFELYEERMKCTAADDWLRAEIEVRAKLKRQGRTVAA